MEVLKLVWGKCNKNSHWCNFINLNINSIETEIGVYLIWYGGKEPKYVRVGQGIIKERLSIHKTEEEILEYENLGLFVTWADVPKNKLDGVEAYLGDVCNPLVGERFPDRTLIKVNLPSD